MKNYWLSWYHTGGDLELYSPWWVFGHRTSDNATIIVAAVKATTEKKAKDLIYVAYTERPRKLEFDRCVKKPDEWSPFETAAKFFGGELFQRKWWMEWSD